MSAVPSTDVHTPMRVLVLDDDEAVRGTLAYQLDRMGHQVYEAADAHWALELYERHHPELILSDVDMPEPDGYWFARQVRVREPGEWTPIIFLSALTDVTHVAEGIAAGGDDYLAKPLHPGILEAKLHAMQRLRGMRERLVRVSADLQQANAELYRLARIDSLTGLLNRRGLDEALQAAMATARRDREPLSLILCDVDHFKNYNDALGHQAGDDCLRRVSALLAQGARRAGDAVARYGGEEFALLLPRTPRAGALTLAHGISRLLQTQALPHPDSRAAPHVTLSGGVTTMAPDDETSAHDLLARADQALYLAKSQGRNRFVSL